MLVLASASPRRRELLTQAGFTFEVRPAHIPEDPKPGEDPIAYVVRLAREKAEAAFRQLAHGHEDTSPLQVAERLQSLSQATTSFVPQVPEQEARALTSAEKLNREVGRGFIPGTKPFESMGASQAAEKLIGGQEVSGHDFSRADDANKTTLASKAAEKLNRVVGRGFIPGTKPFESMGASAPEVGFSRISDETTSFSRVSSAPEEDLNDPIVVLGADTTVVIDNQILGKPEDATDAARMLRLLSGRTHRVITGVALVTAHRTEVAAEVTAVKFLTLSDEEIAAYIATGEPMDKAGAYAIQGRAAKWIPRIEGDYFNVVGLPLALVSTLLQNL